MTCWQIVGLSAGTLILVALALGVPCSPLHVSAWWPPRADRLRRREGAGPAASKE